ncbi:MAG TPA: MgtC/SapB family protein [Acidimicrobiales bacterium]|nr:MgtC/SapB family protein [Acidimicrobiales bacterium]
MSVTTLAGADLTTLSLDGDALVRLLAATVLGAAVGIEREAGDQPAGLRTHIAVALGAALFGVISTLGFLELEGRRSGTNVNIDVTRVASNVAVGIGFLGAGVIFRSGNSIRNLTTAASLWTVAAIGLACGVGDIGTAAVATVVLLGSLVLLRPLRDTIRRRWSRTSLTVRVHLATGADATAFLARLDELSEVELDKVFLEKEDGHVVVAATLSARPDQVRLWMTHVSTSSDVDSLVQV